MNNNPGDVSWKDYIDMRLEERDKRFEQAFGAAKDAVIKAENAQERRLHLLNEFRQQSIDEGKKYALKETVELMHTQLARLYGGMIVIGAIGISNLVRLFYAH